MKLKYIFLFLISLLLTSCNVNSNQSEQIYYLDGLASNLFVYDVMEEYMEFTYIEETDSYDLYVGIEDKFAKGYPCDYRGERFLGFELRGKDIVIPNVYDDGIHGLKRVKSFEIQQSRKGHLNSLIISYGIIEIKGTIINQRFKNISLPSSVEYLPEFATNNIYFLSSSQYLYDLKIDYDGTVDNFNNIIFTPYDDSLFEVCFDKVKKSIQVYCIDGNVNVETTWIVSWNDFI